MILKVIILDDDPIVVMIHKTYLKKCDISTDTVSFSNGELALGYIKDNSQNGIQFLVLLDINMPVMDGFEFLQEYNSIDFKNKREVIIAILTTSEHAGDKIRIEKLGIKCFLNKPLTEEKLRNFIITYSHHKDKSIKPIIA